MKRNFIKKEYLNMNDYFIYNYEHLNMFKNACTYLCIYIKNFLLRYKGDES